MLTCGCGGRNTAEFLINYSRNFVPENVTFLLILAKKTHNHNLKTTRKAIKTGQRRIGVGLLIIGENWIQFGDFHVSEILRDSSVNWIKRVLQVLCFYPARLCCV